jgi:hypothetical protein
MFSLFVKIEATSILPHPKATKKRKIVIVEHIHMYIQMFYCNIPFCISTFLMTFPQETKCKKNNWGIEAIFKWTAYIDQSIAKEKNDTH